MAFKYVKEYYQNDNITELADLARGYRFVREGDALTFKYSNREKETAGDITGAKFVIGDYSYVEEICKYDREPLLSTTWIDLSNGQSSPFWKQAGLEAF
jgi:hypothetical protein